jgi:glycopeptide antibiotics resistance protein
VGAGTSLLTELLQLFSSRRFSSATDVVLNTVGTLL